MVAWIWSGIISFFKKYSCFQFGVENTIKTPDIHSYFEQGNGVVFELPLSLIEILFKSSEDYFLRDITEMVQEELVNLGYELKIDGDFGPD